MKTSDYNRKQLVKYLVQEALKKMGFSKTSFVSPSLHFQLEEACEKVADDLIIGNYSILKQFGLFNNKKPAGDEPKQEFHTTQELTKNDTKENTKELKEAKRKITNESIKVGTKIKILDKNFKANLNKQEKSFNKAFSKLFTISGVKGYGGSSTSSGNFGKIFGTAGNIVAGAFGLSGSILSGASSFIGGGISLGSSLLGAGAGAIGGPIGSILGSGVSIGGGLLGKGIGFAGGLGGMGLSLLGSLLSGGIGLLGSGLSMPGNLLAGTMGAPLVGIASLLYNTKANKDGERFGGLKNMMSKGINLDSIKDLGFDDLLDFSSGLGGILAMFPETSGFGISLLFTSEIARYIKNKWEFIVENAKKMMMNFFGITDEQITKGIERSKDVMNWIIDKVPTAIEKLRDVLQKIKDAYTLADDVIKRPKENLEEMFGIFGTGIYEGYKLLEKGAGAVWNGLNTVQKGMWSINPINGMTTKDGKSLEDAQKFVNDKMHLKPNESNLGKIWDKIWDNTFAVKEAGASTIPTGYFNKPKEEKFKVESPLEVTQKTLSATMDNNIGNMRAKEGFQKFNSLEEGIAANVQLLGFKKDKGEFRYNQKSIREIGYIWAPPEDRNDTEEWIRIVSKVSGFSPNEKLNLQEPETLKRVLKGIGTIEKGGKKIASIHEEIFDRGISLGLSGKQITKFDKPSYKTEKKIETTPSKSPSMIESLFGMGSKMFDALTSDEAIKTFLGQMSKDINPTSQDIEEYNRKMNLPSSNNGMLQSFNNIFQPLLDGMKNNLKSVHGEINHLNTNFLQSTAGKKEENSMDPVENLAAALTTFIQF